MDNDSVSETGGTGINPLDNDQDTRVLTLITLMRLYDVSMALLTKTDPDLAQALGEAHAGGKIIAPLPLLDM